MSSLVVKLRSAPKQKRAVKMADTDADADAPTADGSQANLSDLVKEIVKEMDGDEFYSKPDLYDESAEVRRHF